jgi:2'-5' RNA ligase
LKLRAFLAVPVSGEVKSNAARLISKLAEKTSGVRWVEPENLHITLKFFGDIPVEATHEISKATQSAVAGIEPFEILVSGAGAFPDIERARTVWLGVAAGETQFVELATQIEEQMHELGYPPERRRFHPHLTLGRVRGKQVDGQLTKLLRELDECFIGPSLVDEIALLSSSLERSGPVYSRLATIEF